ncbi:MAG: Beta-lactamase domain protein [Parcubacteria group bacterium GW2011_GWA2_36_10]|nr:MAG: Beta-lactamase domain protein [Parcubacteria group bacterium GW2011_GWA2_36_10]
MNKKLIIITIFCGVLFLGLSLFFDNKKLRVDFLDVGQGDAILLNLPQGTRILVDGGPDNLLLNRLGEVLPWWEHKIDYVVISHYHADHILGLIELVNKYQVGEVLTTAHQPDDFLYHILINKLKAKNIPIVFVQAGQTFDFAKNISAQVYSAESDNEDYNNNSLVLKLDYLQTSLLLTGDLTTEIEDKLVKSGLDLQADLLKVAHHGSRYSSSQAFLAKVEPKFCVISVGEDNDFQHPHPEALARLSASGCQMYLTESFGTLSWQSAGQAWNLLD